MSLPKRDSQGGSVAASAEVRKHSENDQKCEELGWICVPLAVEGYGTWGHGSTAHLLTFGNKLSIRTKQTMSRVATDLHGHLNMLLVKTNSRAVLNCIVDSVVQCSCVIGCTLNKYLIRNYNSKKKYTV